MIGQQILHYKILEKLGEGGIGSSTKLCDRYSVQGLYNKLLRSDKGCRCYGLVLELANVPFTNKVSCGFILCG